MTLGEKIRYLRKQKGYTLEELGAIVGVGKSTVRKWETGKIHSMRQDKITKLAAALDVSPLYLLGGTNVPDPPETGKRVPVLGAVRAGIPNNAIQEIIDFEDITPEMAHKGNIFGLRIRGNSMEPRINDGDTVIVLETPDINNGDIAVVLINGNDATLKQVYKNDNGITLNPFNPAFPPLVFTAKQCRELPVKIIGKAIEVRGKL